MNNFVSFTDDVLESIDQLVTAHPPERGGALLGPKGQSLITQFILDEDAQVTGVAFNASRSLEGIVGRAEGADPATELKGILHSHPASFPQPSEQDHRAFADSLTKAPWLGRFVVPIATSGNAPASDHRLPTASGNLSVFIAEARRDQTVVVQPASPHVLPLAADVRQLAHALGGQPGRTVLVAVGTEYLPASVVQCEGFQLHVVVGASYPFTPPTVLAVPVVDKPDHPLLDLPWVQGSPSSVTALPMRWSQEVPASERLLAALVKAPPKSRSGAARPSRSPGKTDQSQRSADSAPGPAEPEGEEEPRSGEGQPPKSGLFSRLDGVLASGMDQRSVLIVGAGSVGSQVADNLARCGVGVVTLVDPDDVEAANISRSVYTTQDVDMPKVDALSSHLSLVNPDIRVEALADRLQDIDQARLAQLVAASDLVVAATDDPAAQVRLDRLSFESGVPGLFPSMYARGRAGEVAFTVPGVTRCYQCAAATRSASGGSSRETNYGTGRLTAEPALGADIQHIVSLASRIAVAALELSEPESEMAKYLMGALVEGHQMVIVSNVNDFDFFPTVFEGVPGQYASQTAWLGVAGDPDCLTCGENPVRASGIPAQDAPDVSALVPVVG